MNTKNKISLDKQISSAAVRSEQSEAEFMAKQAQASEMASIIAELTGNTIPRSADTPKSKSRDSRNIQVSVRFTPAEHQHLLRKISASGLPQGEYLRHMALSGQVVSRKIPDCDDFLIDEIASLRTITGRLGGLLKMIRNAYEAQNRSDEKVEIWLRETALAMQNFKQHLQAIEVQLNGNN